MLPSADTKFNYAALPTEKAASARAAAERIRGRMQLAAESIIEVGRELIEQKKALGHGNFLPWIAAEFGMSDSSADKYMLVAREFGENSERVPNLSFRALVALSASTTPPEVREEVLERAANGEKVTASEIEKLRKKLDQLEESIAEKESARRFNDARAAQAEAQRDKAQTEAAFLRSDHERLMEEMEFLQEEMARLKESDVLTIEAQRSPVPTALYTPDGKKAKFFSAASLFIKIWNDQPEEWRAEFAIGRFLPEDLVELLNAA